MDNKTVEALSAVMARLDVLEPLVQVVIANHPDTRAIADHWDALLPTLADSSFDLQLDVPVYKETFRKKLAEYAGLTRSLALRS